MMPATPPALRADAERNRELIVATAERLFTTHGLDVPLEEIARQAGVGIATLYRRFPSRTDLITASFERKLADYAAVVRRALDEPDAWLGFCTLIHEMCEMQARDAGLRDALTMTFPATTTAMAIQQQALADGQTLVDRAQRQGKLRKDFVAADMAVLLLANAGVVTVTRESAPGAWRRFVAYMIDAFSTEPAGPLPPAPDHDQVMRAIIA